MPMEWVGAGDDMRQQITGVAPERPTPPPSGMELLGSAFRSANIFGAAAFSAANAGPFEPVPGFNVMEHMKETGSQYWLDKAAYKFVAARSPAEVEAIKAQLRGEEHDREVTHNAGAMGVVATTMAGLFDPTILMPGRVAITAAKEGLLFTRGAAEIGLAAAAQIGTQEAILHATQLDRTKTESAVNVATGTVLAGLIGGAAMRILAREGRLAPAMEGTALERQRMEAHANQVPDAPKPAEGAVVKVGEAAPGRVEAPTIAARAAGTLPEAPVAGEIAATERAVEPTVAAVSRETPAVNDGGAEAISASLSAAATDTRQLRLAGAFGLEKMRDTPMAKALNATLVEARRIAVDLAETALRFGAKVAERDADGNLTGRTIQIAERAGEGPALTRQLTLYESQAKVAVAEKMDELWKDLRFQGENAPYFAKLRDWMGQLDRPPELPTFEQFQEMVGRAMRREDESNIPQVQQAAQFIRERVFEPWKERAIKSGYFGEDVDVKTADSYLQRIYNKQKIRDHNNDFVDRIVNWLRKDQEVKAAAQERLGWQNAQLRSWQEQIGRLEGRVERLDASRAKLGARFDERAMEVGRTEARTGLLDERAAEIADELSDVGEFIASARREIKDPRLLEKLADMEKEMSDLRKLDRPMSEAQLRKIDEDELKGILADPTTRMAAEMVTGRRTTPKAPSFLTYLVTNGGLKDVGGDLLSIMGGTNRSRPGLINSQGREFDQMGIKLQADFAEQFPERDVTGGGAPGRDEILGWIEDAFRGKEPNWWLDSLTPEKKRQMDAAQLANALDEALTRAGVEVNNIRDVAKIFRDDQRAPISLNDLDRITRDMEAVGQDIPVSGRRAAAEENLVVEREAVAELRAAIDRAVKDRARQEANLRVAEARKGEAGFAETQNKGRLAILDERMDRADRRRELMQEMIESANRERDLVRGKIEAEIMAWEGKSVKEAQTAIKTRERGRAAVPAEERTAISQRPGQTAMLQLRPVGPARGEREGRLTSADAAVDSAVRAILERPTNFTDEDFRARAGEISNRILSSPDGRLPYNEAMGKEAGFVGAGEPPRGPLSERPFHISDYDIEDFLESNAETVVHAHLRTIIPDILLTERFGDVNMTNAFKTIEEGYQKMIQAAPGVKERQALFKEKDKVIEAIAGMRDRFRGVYGLDQYNALGMAGRVAQMAKNYNVISSMGMATITSAADLAGAVARWGMGTVFKDAYAPWLRSLMSEGPEWKEAARQFRAMGIATEMVSASRHRAISDIADNYKPQSRLERTLQYGADKMQVLNMLAAWTDWAKTTAAIVSSNEILRAAKAVTQGKATQRQLDALADSRISPAMASKIWDEFSAPGKGEIINGTHLPNTDRWVSQEARMAFEGAVGREADIAVVTPGQEKYLFMSSPVLGVLTQFKSFQVASTTRILIANLQRSDAYTLQGLIFSIGLGMLSYKLNSVLGGQPTSDKPGDWMKEGISRSGITGWFEEGNALAGKLTRGKVDMYRLVGSEKPLSRYAGRSVLDQMLGPTAGKLDRMQRISGAIAAGDWNEHDSHATRQLVFYQNLFWLRGVLNQVERGANNAFGIPMDQKPGN